MRDAAPGLPGRDQPHPARVRRGAVAQCGPVTRLALGYRSMVSRNLLASERALRRSLRLVFGGAALGACKSSPAGCERFSIHWPSPCGCDAYTTSSGVATRAASWHETSPACPLEFESPVAERARDVAAQLRHQFANLGFPRQGSGRTLQPRNKPSRLMARVRALARRSATRHGRMPRCCATARLVGECSAHNAEAFACRRSRTQSSLRSSFCSPVSLR